MVELAHDAGRAHYLRDGVRLCVICDPAPQLPPLTFREWLDGIGGEDRLERFSADYRALCAGTASSEQIERMRYAFAEEA